MTDPSQHISLVKLDYHPEYVLDTYKPEYGLGALNIIPAVRGKTSINNDLFLEYLLDPNSNIESAEPNASNIEFQDLVLPFSNSNGYPKNPEAITLIDEILEAAKLITAAPCYLDGPMWSIQHGYLEQTYPHSHAPGRDLRGAVPLAAVYWAAVPEGSGVLEFYPTGNILMGGNFIKPVVGDFIIFPSGLLHGVRQNTNKTEKRVSVSFNMFSTHEPVKRSNLILPD